MLPKAKRERKQAWMKEETLEFMKERKKYKGTEKYKELDRQVRKECIEAKEDWLNYNCYFIEELSKDNKPRQMYEEIKKFTSNKLKVRENIKNEKGEILMETEQIIKRWSEYAEQLFDDHREENPDQSFLQRPCILASEVAEAWKHMKSGKACDIDGINTEMLKALGDFGIEVLTDLCNCMYSTAYIPEGLKTSVFILLPKKPKATDCSDYRTISLMCHILKFIIMRRMSQKIESEISDRQTGFRKNSGTREAIFSLEVTAERYLEVHKEIFACFIDYSKAFDSVKHEQLTEILQKTDIDENDIAVIANLYWQQRTKIRIDTNMSEAVKTKRGVRQGCVMSPAIFNLYTKYIFRTIDNIPGLTVSGININNL
ncbi:endonuclease-reverse transcriptase [Elysia marginata]|uniref:Endonuclease-reverse transcriptase n=1 Tax=Elysia marginata TaxID=1093978 RepID=A0AAV4ILI6_9GAST|nr:endonuclease-reverse transcriptase [Elysia marginata]